MLSDVFGNRDHLLLACVDRACHAAGAIHHKTYLNAGHSLLDEARDISRLEEEISCFLPLAFLDGFASLSGFFVLCHCLVVLFSHLGVLACLDQQKGKKACDPLISVCTLIILKLKRANAQP